MRGQGAFLVGGAVVGAWGLGGGGQGWVDPEARATAAAELGFLSRAGVPERTGHT